MKTEQEILDLFIAHLSKQGKPALGIHKKNPENECDTTFCMYRTPEGLACGIGGIIPDQHYNKKCEGQPIGLSVCNLELVEMLIKSDLLDKKENQQRMTFLSDLQEIHDFWKVNPSSNNYEFKDLLPEILRFSYKYYLNINYKEI